MRKLTTEELKERQALRKSPSVRAPIYGLLDNIRSLWNVGSIFRTADAVLARKLYLTGMTGRPPRKEIAKTALGAEDSVPWEFVADPQKAALMLKDMGVTVLALEQTDRSLPYTDVAYTFPVCIVVGHEVTGVSSEVVAVADGAVEIPMAGTKESLNVSVAFGIAAAELQRQWNARQNA